MKKLYTTLLFLFVASISLEASQSDLNQQWMKKGSEWMVPQQEQVSPPVNINDQLGGRFTKFSYDILKKVFYA